MDLQASWVEHLFAKLTVRYGVAFARLYPDLDIDLIKADWSEVLDGVSGESLSYALRFLPGVPPNAMQFRDICRRATPPTVAALPAPVERADPGRVAAAMARARSDDPGLSPAERCVRSVLRIVADRGGRVSIAQRLQLEAMTSMLQPATREIAERYVLSLRAGG